MRPLTELDEASQREVERFCGKFGLSREEMEISWGDASPHVEIKGRIAISTGVHASLPRSFQVVNRIPEGLIVDVTKMFPRWSELHLTLADRLSAKYCGEVREIIAVERGKRWLTVITPPDCIIIDVNPLIAIGG